jgi:FemAB-related protein (PEP-CTERM system-associated)
MSTTTRRTTPADAEARALGDAAPDVQVRSLSDRSATAAWARYVENTPNATLCHHPDWCDAVEQVFYHQPRHLRATRNGQLVGVLPLMQVNSFLGGRMLVSVPYGTYGGILADDATIAAALAAEAMQLAEECEARVVDLRSATANAPGFAPVEGYLGFARDLPLHPNDVPAFIPKRPRAAARHARDRDGITIRHDVKLARVVWDLYARSMRRIASVNYPFRFFAALIERLQERAWVSVAFQQDRPVCGTISFVFRDTVMPYILGADERVRSEGAANLLYLEIMERAVRSGLRRFDYGRSRADNRGAVGFKKNQGFTPQPLGYQRYVPPGQRAPDLKPSNPRFALARRLWTRLPLPVSRLLGAWLARSIPG